MNYNVYEQLLKKINIKSVQAYDSFYINEQKNLKEGEKSKNRVYLFYNTAIK